MNRFSQLCNVLLVTGVLASAAAVAREPDEPPRREDRREDRRENRREDPRENRHQDRNGPSGRADSGRDYHERHSGHGQRGSSHASRPATE